MKKPPQNEQITSMEDEKAQRCLCGTAPTIQIQLSTREQKAIRNIFLPLTRHHNRQDRAFPPKHTAHSPSPFCFEKALPRVPPRKNGTHSLHSLAVDQTSYSRPLPQQSPPTSLSYTVHYSAKLFAAKASSKTLACTRCRTRRLSFDPTPCCSVLGGTALCGA